MEQKWIVEKVDDGMDRTFIQATTYQMRNPFGQFADGCATELDVHCYFQHAFAAQLCPVGGTVLDVCCGRGLLIPFLRYGGKPPSLYVGVDIHPANARWKDGRDPRRESQTKADWGFKLVFVQSNVAKMAAPILAAVTEKPFDLIVYTSSIEHMQPSDQQQSLKECRDLAGADTKLYLTCPVSEEGHDGYDAQYAAHVYEPTRSELLEWLSEASWEVESSIGISTKSTHFRKVLRSEALKTAEHLYSVMPRAQALPSIAALYPECATEMAYVCRRTNGKVH